MASYWFTRWRRSARGAVPDLPRRGPFNLLAQPREPAQWALVRADLDRAPPRARPVPPELATLLASAEAYPPALALAAHQLARGAHPRASPALLAQRLASALRTQLRRQHEDRHFLAQARAGEDGHLAKGEFVWVIRLRREPASGRLLALWVSDDFRIYENPAAHFRIPRAMLRSAHHAPAPARPADPPPRRSPLPAPRPGARPARPRRAG